MSKAHILKLLNDKAHLQNELDELKASLKFDANTIQTRITLLRKLFAVTSELSTYTPEQVNLALNSKEKAKSIIKKHTIQEDEEETVFIDNSLTRFLLYMIFLQNAKPDNKFFIAIAINALFGDRYERRYKTR
ncbi:hypothetical protein KGP84_28680 [Burkholderia multivorans]|uniref:hypothetical protein n=1 Tax=Burkholderia cepacia complex TaxID=87882 RepID=UPI001C24B967|nr:MULTISPECIES: hypothetical protein [Burkholderia cepacia complex]MCB4345445.1 hypothetical protein [Burkholderia vietnamiensis]MBU9692937.1 hypothetical protein [Burkholderia multivorans]MCO8554119.1 hypothetical protein [Burkholderia multivorans]MCO8555488.1 hypothetical protein [Burkholderia multivorans]MCO8620234.1 hypothetical protein [Burkholderia multivorans]